MRKLFGNGRPLAAAVLAVGIAAVAVPAFGDSGATGGAGQAAAARPPRPGALPPPPGALPPMTGAMRKRADKVATCMRSKDIPGAQKRGAGFFIGPSAASSKAFRKAAKECGAPGPPPKGRLLPPPMGAPGARAELDKGVVRCFQQQRSQQQRKH